MKKASDREKESRLTQLLGGRSSPYSGTSPLVITAGVTLLAGGGGGLYWLVPTVIIALVGGGLNAWLLLIRLGE
ncbi:MAG: hypothetical protein WB770_11225 [Acidimicrobiales bacterium]